MKDAAGTIAAKHTVAWYHRTRLSHIFRVHPGVAIFRPTREIAVFRIDLQRQRVHGSYLVGWAPPTEKSLRMVGNAHPTFTSPLACVRGRLATSGPFRRRLR